MNDSMLSQASPDDHAEDLSRIEPDILLLADYLANELPPDERAKVDHRLATDEEFARMAAPLIYVWRMPLLPGEEQVLEESGVLPITSVGASAPDKPRRRWTMATVRERMTVSAVLAASFLIWIVRPTAMDYATRIAQRSHGAPAVATVPRSPRVVPPDEPAPTVVAATDVNPPAPMVSKAVRLKANVLPVPGVISTLPNMLLYSQRLPKPADLAILLAGRTLLADEGATLRVELEDGTFVTLRGPASFNYVVAPPPLPDWALAKLTGEAVLEVSVREGMMRITGPGGRVFLREGRFAVRVDPVDGTILVTVESGYAELSALGADGKTFLRAVQFKAGEFGRLVPGGTPEHADGVGFPRVRVP